MRAAVLNKRAELGERAIVEKLLDPLARGELALLVLRVDAFLAAALQRLLAQAPQLFYLFRSGHPRLLEKCLAVGIVPQLSQP